MAVAISKPPSISASQGQILIVDDEPAIRLALRTTLTAFGFDTEEASSGEEGLRLFRTERFEAVLLDINLPGMDGIETCREMRRQSSGLSIIMLSVRETEDEKVRAFDAGADDYITKPFHISELTARLRSAVRRSRLLGNASPGEVSIGEIEINPSRRTIKKRGRFLHLTPKEFDLLHYLMAHAGAPIAHARLLQAVWGPEHGNELEYLRTFVRQLRLKIEDTPAEPVYLKTDAYIGYRFLSPQEALAMQSETNLDNGTIR